MSIIKKGRVSYEMGNIGMGEAGVGDVLKPGPGSIIEIIVGKEGESWQTVFITETGRGIRCYGVWNYGRKIT
ncbi:MAG: hypothetical protein KKG75_05165 [Nanoarchaeota archaeon]|nr:hypothetical protein [Nanoarchaeota archaeon]